MQKGFVALLFSAIIISNALLAYQPHLENPFPLIGDEYVHISFGKYILEEQALPFTNPYFTVPLKHTNLESGFHFLLTVLFAVIPGEPVLFYKYFVIIFSVINSILVFYLVRTLTKDPASGLAAMFFFGTLKSSGGILTHQYFVPSTLGITFLLLLFILFHHFLEKRTWTSGALFIGALGATAISYPPTLFFFLGIALVYLFSPSHTLHETLGMTRRKFLDLFTMLTLIAAGLFVFLLYALGVLDRTVFSSSWEVIQMRYSLLLFPGIITSIFAGIGLAKIGFSKEPWPTIFLYWFLFGLFALYSFHLFGASILLPYPRLFVFYLIGVSILAGIGLAEGARLARRAIEAKYWSALMVATIIVLCATHYISVWKQPLSHHEILTPDIYAALTFLRESSPKDAVVIADSITSLAIYPTSYRHVVNLLDSNIGGGRIYAANIFLTGACDEKKGVFNRFDREFMQVGVPRPPIYLLSQRTQKCNFLTLKYDKGPYVYSVEL